MLNSNMPLSPFSELFLLDFTAQGDSYTLKHKQTMTGRKFEDREQYVRRKDEDKRYSMRAKHNAEDNKMWNTEKMIEDKELVNDQMPYGVQNWRTKPDAISPFQETKAGSIAWWNA